MTPERIRCGGLSFSRCRQPIITQSVGVPLTAKRRSAICAQAQRHGEGERMGGARLLGFRRDHPDIVGKRAGDLFRDGKARRVDAVVIGDKNAHQAFAMTVLPPM